MTKKNIFLSTAAAIVLIFFSGYNFIVGGEKIPEGWFKAGSKPSSYEVGTEVKEGMNKENAVYLKSNEENITGFGTLMQNFSADKYLNKRVRLSGYVKSKDVVQWAGLWMRIDGKQDSPKMLGFDNMQDRPIKGTSSWKKYDVVLDVPSNSAAINFGILLTGTGEVWLSNLKFEVVDNSVPTTNMTQIQRQQNKQPTNLNFEN